MEKRAEAKKAFDQTWTGTAFNAYSTVFGGDEEYDDEIPVRTDRSVILVCANVTTS
jgi:hypothetical protein